MKKVIFDCDNTLGVKNCDLDDGLALLYLLGSKKADVIGMSLTYGNSDIETVYRASKSLLSDIGREDIPLKKGGADRFSNKSEASEFLAEQAHEHKGEISLLATGSLTNLYGAYLLDNSFFENIKELVLMGGVTEPLLFQKRQMDELNFSCDPLASLSCLSLCENVSVITGNNCLKIAYTLEEFRQKLFMEGNSSGKYIFEKSRQWFSYNDETYGIDFYNWDVYAACYLLEPELFEDNRAELLTSEGLLSKGYLHGSNADNAFSRKFEKELSSDKPLRVKINIPSLAKPDKIKQSVYRAWNNVSIV